MGPSLMGGEVVQVSVSGAGVTFKGSLDMGELFLLKASGVVTKTVAGIASRRSTGKASRWLSA